MSQTHAPTKAVIPAAGLGTRFLPATKAMPKEMLAVIDTPAIEFVVREAADAGLDDVLLITSRTKKSIEDHFDAVPDLEAALAAKGDTAKVDLVRASSNIATVHSVRQQNPAGLGHAVLCAAQHVGNEPFAVLLGDDLIDERDKLLREMLDVQGQFGGSVIALMEVDPAQSHLYGCAAVTPTDRDGVVRVNDLVEKPAPGTAPSNYAVIGRYVLDPAVFDVLRETPPGKGNEIQLTDALLTLANLPAEQGGTVYGVVFTGRRYDTGDKLGYLQAVVQLASEREDLGPAFTGWLREFSAGLPQA
ncbi:UTP--glucose-1-phosphate uridylyltransferase [Micrococcales bacterium 31B]|nr:UTP--glucose-1-phosphate uridylyltransferase [Micrococcales bacterium 31B]